MPTTIRPGDTLADRYRLDDLLSESGTGRFWRAHDRILQRHVALHVIAADDERAPGLLEAARRSATVINPRILRVLDAQLRSDVCFVVNEWGHGTSLDIALANNGPLVPRRAAWLVAEVAESVAVAHAHGVHHGRLVPENVLIDAGGTVRIIGFSVDAAMHGLPAGDESADVVDLAGLLYAALTGKWGGESSSSVPQAPHENGRVLRPRQVRAGVPRPLDDLVDEILNPETARLRGTRDLSTAGAVASFLSDFVGDPAGIADSLAAANPTRGPDQVVLDQVPDIAVRPDEPEVDAPPVVAAAAPPAPAPAPLELDDEMSSTAERPAVLYADGRPEPTIAVPRILIDQRLQAAALALASGATPTVTGPDPVVEPDDLQVGEPDEDPVPEPEDLPDEAGPTAPAPAPATAEPVTPVVSPRTGAVVPVPRSRAMAKRATQAARTAQEADPIGSRIDYFTSLYAGDDPLGIPKNDASWEDEDWNDDDEWPADAVGDTADDTGNDTPGEEAGELPLAADRADVAAALLAPEDDADLTDDDLTDLDTDLDDEDDLDGFVRGDTAARIPAVPGGPVRSRPLFAAGETDASDVGERRSRLRPDVDDDRPWDRDPDSSTGLAAFGDDTGGTDDTGTEDDSDRGPRPRWLQLAGLVAAVALVVLVVAVVRSRGSDEAEPAATPATTTAAVGGAVITGLSAEVLDPTGNPGGASEGVDAAIDGDPSTSWKTGTFTEQFSPDGARAGLGIVIDTGSDQSISQVDLELDGEPTYVVVYVLDQLPQSISTLQSAADFEATSQESISLRPGTTGRYVAVWLTKIPQVGANYEGGIAEVTLHS